MFELELLPTLLIFFAGVVIGIGALMISNKLSSGSVSASKIKKEKDAYQTQVEAHFEETSVKFKQMAAQYQDLYQHMSVGASTLCRPENIAQGLTDQRDPLSAEPKTSKPIPKPKENTRKTDSQKNKKPESKKINSSQSVKNTKSNTGHKPQAAPKSENVVKGDNPKAPIKSHSAIKTAEKNTAK